MATINGTSASDIIGPDGVSAGVSGLPSAADDIINSSGGSDTIDGGGGSNYLNYTGLGAGMTATFGSSAYVGTVIIAGASAMVAFLQFGTINMALLVGGASLLIHAITGNLLTPWLTSRASRMSPVAVFVGMLAWGWLWGVWGLLLGIPILMMVKAVCDRVDDLKPIGEFLGN